MKWTDNHRPAWREEIYGILALIGLVLLVWWMIGAKAHGAPAPSIVRIAVDRGGCTTARGSGVLIDTSDPRASYIYTAEHVIGTGGNPLITFPDGKRYQGRVAFADRKVDFAVVKISKAHIRGRYLAQSDPRHGEPLFLAGYGARRGYHSWVSQSASIFHPAGTRVEAPTYAENGTSGGPIINSRGEVVSIISEYSTMNQPQWGGQCTSGTCGPSTRYMRRAYVLPWRARVAATARGQQNFNAQTQAAVNRNTYLMPIVPAQRPIQAPTYPQPDPISSDLDQRVTDIEGAPAKPPSGMVEIRDKVAANTAAIKQLAAVAPIPGPPGRDGIDGTPGRDGTNGKDADPASLDEIKARPTGFWYQSLNHDGQPYGDKVWVELGRTLNVKPLIVPAP